MMAAALDRLKREVIARTGHHYYVDKERLLYERCRERMAQIAVASFEDYVALLERGDGEEWRRLEDAITIGETYFFRYPDHFAALRETILPKLIAAREETRHLRIWSIGCSTGAEPYSVAIVLRELLDEQVDNWRITIIGGDISEKALSAARSGRFGAWALRTMAPEDRARYFTRDGSHWVLKREYRTMVRFARQNILDLLAPVPPLEWSGFDLILCRNVLIYFSTQQATDLIRALKGALAPDGVMLLGHAEATLTANEVFGPTQALPTEFAQAAVPPVEPSRDYVPPIVPPLPLSLWPQPASAPQTEPGPDVDQIQLLADAGAYEAAGRLCEEMLRQEPTSARLHYYAAILHQVSDDLPKAEASLRRALYLDRAFIVAHHRLGTLLLSQGRMPEARRALQAAVRLAEDMPEGAELPEGRGVSAGELASATRAQLEAMGAPE